MVGTLEYFFAKFTSNWRSTDFFFLFFFLFIRLFLKGLKQYGKGDWRSISRNVVVTRTPTQVASHAQKYFLRQGSGKKERKRSSIHDITSTDVDGISVPMPVDQNSIPPQPQQMPTFPQLNSPPNHMTRGTNHGGPMGFQNFNYQMWHWPLKPKALYILVQSLHWTVQSVKFFFFFLIDGEEQVVFSRIWHVGFPFCEVLLDRLVGVVWLCKGGIIIIN